MYFMDFAKSVTVEGSCRYFLAGENEFLKNYAIDKISTLTGRQVERVSSVSEIQPLGLFRGGVPICVLGGKSNPKNFRDFMIKVSKSKMGKTYKDNGFVEVTCSNLFPSQVNQFASMLLKARGMPVSFAKTIAELSKYDPYSVYNAIHALSVLDKKEITQTDLYKFCKNLTAPDLYKVIDYFIEAKYEEFLIALSETRIDIHGVLWGLLGALSSLQRAYFDAPNAVSWYQKKMAEASYKIAPFGFEKILSYVNDTCVAYGENREVLLLKIQRLIFYLRGLSNRL
jgi:DNA polymerase III delta subunit